MVHVTLLGCTPNPEKTIAAAAKLCYSASSVESLLDNLTDEKATDFVRMLSDIGHESPIEHASFTFGIEGVSRAFLAQITRHRIASYSVQSQRYVTKNQFEYVLPPAIAAVPEAKAEFERAMQAAAESYERITALLLQGDTDNAAKKKAIEDARFVLPNACDTKMVVTMNARSLLNFFAHRCCMRAQWEIREAADQMLALVYSQAPALFKTAGPPCVRGNCPEGRMTCGAPDEVRARIERIKAGV